MLDTLIMIANSPSLILASVSIFGIFFAFIGIIIQIRSSLKIHKQKNTLDCFYKHQDFLSDSDSIIYMVSEIMERDQERKRKRKGNPEMNAYTLNQPPDDELSKLGLKADEWKYNKRSVLGILGYFDGLALGIKKNLVDEDILIYLVSDDFINVFEATKDLIYKYREDYKNNNLYLYYEEVYLKYTSPELFM